MPTAHHPDRWNIDEFLQSSYPNGGFAKILPMPIGSWESVGAGAAAITRALIDTGTNDLLGLVWADTAGATAIAAWGGTVPDDYDPRTDKLKLLGRIRKEDLSGSENADLALTCKMLVLREGDTFPAVITGTSVVAPAKATADTLAAFVEFEFNFDGNGIKPGQPLDFRLSVDQTVGTDLSLQVICTRLWYHGGVSLFDRDSRTWVTP